MRIGVVGGAGKIGQLRIQSINENPDTALAAVLDISLDAARTVAGDAPAFTELNAFLETDMDAVIVSTPPHVHEGTCVGALKQGLHVLVEKPMASTPQACQRIVAAGEKAGRTVATGFNMRYYPAFDFVKQAVTTGKIGEIDHIRAFGGHQGLANFAADWQYKAPQSGGGAMWDVGIHITDMVRYLLGEITSVYGVASKQVWKVDGSEDNAMAVMKNPTGVAAIYQATWNEWTGYKSLIEVYGSHGMVRGSYAPMHNMLITQSEPGGKAQTTTHRYLDVAVREKLKSWKSTALLSFAEELVDFIRLTKGESGLRIADGYAGMRAIEVAVAVAQSTKANEVVTLPELHPARP